MAEKDANTLLTQEQREICQVIAAKKIETQSQRAEALLAVDDGQTQAKAAESSGLTVGQVRYLITNFRKKGMELFPEELLAAKKPEVKKEAPVKAEEPAKKETQKEKQDVVEEEKPAAKKKRKKGEKKKKKAKRKQAKQSRKASKSKKNKKKGKKKKKKK